MGLWSGRKFGTILLGFMLSSPVEEIKNRLDIVEVVGSYIKLQKAGVNFRATCPFHSEKKPSFFVSPSRQIWHCFGCGLGGDIFKFVMQIEGVEFGDALRLLAQKAGVELKKQDPKLKTERNRLYQICELACRFFEKQLEQSSTGREAKNYLLSRGIKPDSLKKWRLGYAPDAWQGLSDFLLERGYSKEEIQKAGLGMTSERGSFFDRFRSRIVFPVFDLNSQVVGFGGRVFNSDDPAKYVNTPATLLYDKSRILYGLDKAKVEIRKKESCILVEGYIDAIMCHQAGYENTVATSGTALTPFQLKVLKRYSDNLLTAFDMDVAGNSATKGGIDLAQAQGFNIKVILMPEGKDPADLISDNPTDWQRRVQESKNIYQFYFETTFARFDSKSPQGKKDIAKIILPIIKRIPNKIEQYHWIQKLAKGLDTKEESIEEELKKVSPGFYDPPAAPSTNGAAGGPPAETKTRKEMLEERIASLVLQRPENRKFLDQECLGYLSPRIQNILAGRPSPQDQDFVSYLLLKGEVEGGEVDGKSEIQICAREIKALEIRNRMSRIRREIEKAEEKEDAEKVDILVKRFNQLSAKLIHL